MDVLVICRDALCSKEINKEKLNLISKGQATESNESEWWIDRPGIRCQSPAWVFRRKIENINVHTS